MHPIVLLYFLFKCVIANPDLHASDLPRQWDWKRADREDNNSSSNGCLEACQLLHRSAPFEVALANTTDFTSERANYWSTFQSDVSPVCFVEPNCAEDVAEIIRIARHTECKFAVKSGGHAAFAGASNIPDGMTILLKNLNELSLSADQKITRVGTGNVWINVYDYLTPKNLSVVGGRVNAIGTGGLTLGGGISFFSGRYGWACDGIANYELVTADSQILQVNLISHPDLYWALRGGGNNFGIVTRLDMETFPQGPIWGGTRLTNESTFPALLDALWSYSHRAPSDVDSAMYTAFVYTQNTYLASTFLTHAGGVASPPIFANFTAPPALTTTLRLTNLTDLTTELNATNPNGLRESYQTHAFHLTRPLLPALLSIWQSELPSIADVPGLLPALLLQPLPSNVVRHFARHGGNALGIAPADAPLLLMSLSVWWTRPADDARVLAALRRIVERCVARSRERGAFHRFVYMNYAAEWQDVFAGYGEENRDRLRRISVRWDPEGVLAGKEGLWPGYFKLRE